MSEKSLTIFIIVFILIISFISFLFSPYFKLRNVEITGAKAVDKKQIESDISDFLNHNIWLIDTEKIEENLSQKGYIKHIEIKKRLPDKIVLNIQERTPLAKINNNGVFLLFNKNGFIIDEGSMHQFEVPEIRGVGYIFKNERIIFPSEISEIVQALASLNTENKKYIKTVRKKEENIDLYLKENMRVNMGEIENLDRKFSILDTLLERMDNDIDFEYVDLSIINKPVIKKE